MSFTRFAGYEVLSEVGRGATATVYRARARDGTDVALKVLDESPAPGAALRFRREQRLLATLGERRGFVPLLDAGGPPGAARAFIVMPFLEGGTLRDRLRDGPLPVRAAVALGIKLAKALHAAHGLGIVHRDVKPENVLFTRHGEPLIADFGLAKEGAPDHALSETGVIMGTLSYMAPEQLRDAKRAGPAADVFALGALLHECLSGEPPFPGFAIEDVARSVLRGVVSPIRRAGVPAALEAVVKKALHPDPARRHSSAASLARALANPARSARAERASSGAWRAIAGLLGLAPAGAGAP